MPRSWSCVTAGLRRLSRRRYSTVASPHQHQQQQQPGTTLSFDLFPRLGGLDDDRTPTQTIMFLHGILGSKRNWRTPAVTFRKQQPQFQCVTVDFRGHGDSATVARRQQGDDTVAGCAVDIAAVAHAPTLGLSTATGAAVPDLLSGHSFGGKVALQYLSAHIMNAGDSSGPRHTWIIDSLPGVYDPRASGAENGDFQSVFRVLDVLEHLPTTFKTRDAAVALMMAPPYGFDKPLAQWIATNLVQPPSGDGFVWGFDLPVIQNLFTDFCTLDMWPFVEGYDGDGTLHFLRAGRNRAWTPAVLRRFEEAQRRSGGKVRLHTMPHVGHWVHADDLLGLLAVVTRESGLQR